MSVHTKIKKELDSNNTLYGVLSNADTAAELNAVDKDEPVRVPISDFIHYLSAHDLVINLVAMSNNAAPDKARPAQAILWLLSNPHVNDIDVNALAFTEGLGSLKADSVLVSDVTAALIKDADAVEAEIIAMGNKIISRADKLGLGRVTEESVRIARAN